MSRRRKSEREFRITIKGQFCVYCGEWAQCYDHFPPHSASIRGFLLPSCQECNNLAGTDFPFNFDSRRKLVIERLSHKYRKVLETPDWSQGEMRPLKYNLKTMVKGWQLKQKIARRRVAWNALVYLACIDRSRDFVQLNAEINTMPEKERDAFMKQMKLLEETISP